MYIQPLWEAEGWGGGAESSYRHEHGRAHLGGNGGMVMVERPIAKKARYRDKLGVESSARRRVAFTFRRAHFRLHSLARGARTEVEDDHCPTST